MRFANYPGSSTSRNGMSKQPDDRCFPLDANGQAFISRQYRNGIPLPYVGEKLRCAIEDLHRHARRCPGTRDELSLTMHYLLAAYLGLYNMLGAANDPALVDRLLDGSRERLQKWLRVVERGGDVCGVAELDS